MVAGDGWWVAGNERDGQFKQIRNREPKGHALLCLDFNPLWGSKIGERTATWEIVLGYSPEYEQELAKVTKGEFRERIDGWTGTEELGRLTQSQAPFASRAEYRTGLKNAGCWGDLNRS